MRSSICIPCQPPRQPLRSQFDELTSYAPRRRDDEAVGQYKASLSIGITPHRLMGRLPESPLSLHGGCLCRAVRYTIEVPVLQDRPQAQDAQQGDSDGSDDHQPRMPLVSWCHCTSCRVGSGGLVASWLGTPQAWVTFTTKEANGTTRHHVTRDILLGANALDQKTTIGVYCHTKDNFRTFCRQCGSSLTFAEEGEETFRGMGPLVDIATGTLDNDSLDLVRADRHTCWSDGRGWIKDLFRKGDEGSLKHEKGTMGKVME